MIIKITNNKFKDVKLQMRKIMSEQVTKEDLRQFSQIIINEIRNERKKEVEFIPDWLKSQAVKKSLSISATSLQSLRITGKVRCRKILGSYYYSKTDLSNLFKD
jgi:hypothetical protein